MFEFVFICFLGAVLSAMIIMTPAILAMVLIPKIFTGAWGQTTRLGLWFFFVGLLLLGITRFIPDVWVVCGTGFFSLILIFMGVLTLIHSTKERKSKEGFLTTGSGLFIVMICTIISVISGGFYSVAEYFSSAVSYYTSIFFLIGALGIVSNREEINGAHQTCAGAAGVLYIINFLLIYYGPLFVAALWAGSIFSGASISSSMEMMLGRLIILIAVIEILSVLCPTLLVFGLEDKKGKIILSSAFFTGLAGVISAVKIVSDVLNLSTKDITSAIYSHPLTGAYYALSVVSGLLFCAAFILAWWRYTHHIPIRRYTSVIEKEGAESRVIKTKTSKSAAEIYLEKQKTLYGVAHGHEKTISKPLLLRCKKCGEVIRITDVRRPLKIRCPKCGSEGILR